MFLYLETEVSTGEVIKQMLESNSPEYWFYLIAKQCNHINPEDFSQVVNKLMGEGIE